MQRFGKILPEHDGSQRAKRIEILLRSIGYENPDYRFGETRVFFRPGKLHLFDMLRRNDMENLNAVETQMKRFYQKLNRRRVKAVFLCSVYFVKREYVAIIFRIHVHV